MAEFNLGRVRGTMFYSGTEITGTSTEPTIFSDLEVNNYYENDKYLNVSNGNVYECAESGTNADSTWVYIGNLRGPVAELENTVNSASAQKALTANMGKYLNDKINNAGIYPYEAYPTYTDKVDTITLTIEDKNTTITVYSDGSKQGTYTYTSTGSGAKIDVSLSVGPSMGFTDNTNKVLRIASSAAVIYGYKMYKNTVKVEDRTLNLWADMNNLIRIQEVKNAITDGATSKYTSQLKANINSTLTEVFPITHAKAIWYSIADNKTVYDEIVLDKASIASLSTSITSLTTTMNSKFDAVNQSISDINNQIDSAVANAGFKKIYAGTSALTPGTSPLTSGTIYIQYV